MLSGWNDINLVWLLHCGVSHYGVFSYKPFLTIDFIVKSHRFNPNQYINRTYENREVIHNRINELVSDGLGYKRIHKVLVREKFDIGKSPSCMFSMIKKLEKRERILNQKTIIELGKIEVKVFPRTIWKLITTTYYSTNSPSFHSPTYFSPFDNV